MRVSMFELFKLHVDLDTAIIWSTGATDCRESIVLKVVDENGNTGWGETINLKCWPLFDDILHQLIAVEVDELQIVLDRIAADYRIHGCYNGLIRAVMGTINICILDLVSKERRVPLYQLFGGKRRERIRVYASSLYYYPTQENEHIKSQAQKFVEMGFDLAKVKVGKYEVLEDIERIRLFCSYFCVSSQSHIMLDGNQAYNANTFTTLVSQIDPFPVLWFEEPFMSNFDDIYIANAANGRIPLAVGENWYSAERFFTASEVGSASILQPNIVNIGGFHEASSIIEYAQNKGMSICPHNWGTMISFAASVHYAALLPRIYENVNDSVLLECDCSENPLRDNLCTHKFNIKDGFIEIPKMSGLGISVDEEYLQAVSQGKQKKIA